MNRLTLLIYMMGCLAAPATTSVGEPHHNASEHQFVEVAVPPLGSGSFRFPRPDEILEIEVELYKSSRTQGIPLFKVDPTYTDKTLQFFEAAVINETPWILWPDTGSLKLTLKSGETMRVAVHDIWVKRPLEFSIRGVRLVQQTTHWEKLDEEDGIGSFESAVSKIYYWQTGHCVRKPTAATLKQLGLDKEP